MIFSDVPCSLCGSEDCNGYCEWEEEEYEEGCYWHDYSKCSCEAPDVKEEDFGL